jgi:hypothetical protein
MPEHRHSLSEALSAHYEQKDSKRKSKQERWAPGADPLERVRRLAELVESSPGYADTLNRQDRAAVGTFLTRKHHLAAQNNNDEGDTQ